MSKEKIWSKAELVEQMQKGGITQGMLLHLKISMRSIGKIDGGAATLLDALLEAVGPNGTLIVDAYVPTYPLPLSKHHEEIISTEKSPTYTGVFNNIVIQHPDCVRSKHPIQRFAAIGKLAKEIMHNHLPDSGGYQVLEDLINRKAYNLFIGMEDLRVASTHYSQEAAGLIKHGPKRGVNYIDDNGDVKLAEVNWSGGCSRGFSNLIPLFENAGLTHHFHIGCANAIITNMKETFDLEVSTFRKDPSYFLCNDRTCKDCQLNWEHSTGNYWAVKFHSMIKIIRDNIKRQRAV